MELGCSLKVAERVGHAIVVVVVVVGIGIDIIADLRKKPRGQPVVVQHPQLVVRVPAILSSGNTELRNRILVVVEHEVELTGKGKGLNVAKAGGRIQQLLGLPQVVLAEVKLAQEARGFRRTALYGD